MRTDDDGDDDGGRRATRRLRERERGGWGKEITGKQDESQQ